MACRTIFFSQKYTRARLNWEKADFFEINQTDRFISSTELCFFKCESAFLMFFGGLVAHDEHSKSVWNALKTEQKRQRYLLARGGYINGFINVWLYATQCDQNHSRQTQSIYNKTRNENEKKNYNFKPQRIERKATPSIFKALCIWERDRAKDKVVRNKWKDT